MGESVTSLNRPCRIALRPPIRIAVGGAMGFFLLGLIVAAYGPLIPALRVEFGSSATTAGLLLSAHFAGSVTGVALAGALTRHTTTGTRFVCEAGLVVVGAVVLLAAPTWLAIFVGVLLLGLGFGGLDLDLNVFFATAYGDGSTKALNLLSAAFGLGAIAGPLVVAVTDANRMMIAVVYLTLATSLVPFLGGARAAHSVAAHTSPGVGRHRLTVAAFLTFYLLYVSAENGVASWAPTYLIEVAGTSAAFAAGNAAAFWTAFTLGRVLAALLSTHVPPATLLPATLLLAATSIALASWPPAAASGFVLAGLFLAPVFPTGLTWLARKVPAVGVGTALVIGGANFGPVLVSPIIGQAHDRAGASGIVVALTTVTVLNLLLAVVLRRANRS